MPTRWLTNEAVCTPKARVRGRRAEGSPPPRSFRVRETKGLDLGGGRVSALADVLGEQSHVPQLKRAPVPDVRPGSEPRAPPALGLAPPSFHRTPVRTADTTPVILQVLAETLGLLETRAPVSVLIYSFNV